MPQRIFFKRRCSLQWWWCYIRNSFQINVDCEVRKIVFRYMLIVKYEEIRKNQPAIGQLNSKSVIYADVKYIYIKHILMINIDFFKTYPLLLWLDAILYFLNLLLRWKCFWINFQCLLLYLDWFPMSFNVFVIISNVFQSIWINFQCLSMYLD